MQNAFFRGCFITFYPLSKVLVERSKHWGDLSKTTSASACGQTFEKT